MKVRIITMVLACLCGCSVPDRHEAPSIVALHKSADGHRWTINGRIAPRMKGVVYQPTEEYKHISHYYYKSHKLPHLYAQILTPEDAKAIQRDFEGKGHGEQMLQAGINAIRVYHLPVEDRAEVALIKAVFRRAFQRYGIRVLVGDWVGLYEQPNDDALNERRIETLVDLYADEPWVLAWQIGNENNYYIQNGRLESWIRKPLNDYYSFMDRLASVVKAAESKKRGKHPVILGQGDLTEAELASIARLRHFDAIGLNLFTSAQRADSILWQLKGATSLSVLLSEIGGAADAADQQQQRRQAELLHEQMLVWRNHLAGHDRTGIAVAVFIYEWSDEVWRGTETGLAKDGQFGIHGKAAFARLLATTDQFRPFVPKSDAPEDLLEVVFAYLDARHYWDSILYAQRIVDTYQHIAVQQQADAHKELARFGPRLWALNAVGVAYFLQGRAYYEWGDKVRARRAFHTLAAKFPSATLRDKSGKTWLLSTSVRRLFPDMVTPYLQLTWLDIGLFVLATLAVGLLRRCILSLGGFLNHFRRRQTARSGIKTVPVMTLTHRVEYIVLHSAVMVAFCIFLVWWFHPVRSEMYFVHPVLFWALSFVGICNVLFHLYLWNVLSNMARPVYVPAPKNAKVAMATTYVKGEPLEMVKNTLLAMVQVEYPHHTYVLDESNDPALKSFCEDNDINHFSRKGVSQYNKADGPFQTRTKGGNINAWIDACGKDYEFVTLFDPDHAPVPQYLDRVLGYFSDPQVAFVQPPQIYNNQDEGWIARGGAERSYYFYGPVQMGLFGLDAPVLIGSHNTIRMAALRNIGGYKVHNADDLLTSLHLHAKGWRGIYVPEVLASGLTPNDWTTFFQQQFRWAHSVMDVMHHHFPSLLGRLKFRQAFGYAIMYFYYLNGLNFLLLLALPLVSSLWNVAIVNAHLAVFLQYFLPFFGLFYALMLGWGQKFLIQPRKEAGVWYRGGLLWVATWPYLVWAFVRALLPSKTPPRITTSKESAAVGSSMRMFRPHLIYVFLVVLAVVHSSKHPAEYWFSEGMLIFLGIAFVSHVGLIATGTSWFARWQQRRSKPKLQLEVIRAFPN